MFRFYLVLIAIAMIAPISFVIHWMPGLVVSVGTFGVWLGLIKFHKQLLGIELAEATYKEQVATCLIAIVALIAVIFVLLALPDAQVPTTTNVTGNPGSTLDTLKTKGAHVVLFGGLAFLLFMLAA